MPDKYNTLDLIMTCIVLVVPVFTLMVTNSALLFIAVSKGNYGNYGNYRLREWSSLFIFASCRKQTRIMSHVYYYITSYYNFLRNEHARHT